MRPFRHAPTLFLLLATACAADASGAADDDLDLADGPFDLAPQDEDGGKADSLSSPGPRVSGLSSATEVWAVRRQWTDVTDEAGVAWGARSGLSWEEKYRAWVEGFEEVPSVTRSGSTFHIRTPYGDRSFDAPTLECAEVAMLLRVTFAAWHGLPFFLEGWDASTRKRIYAGHFGFVDGEGRSVGRFPSYATAYRDHRSSWVDGAPWPSDAVLRGRRLGADDGVPFLTGADGQMLGAGAYFDGLFLNKRVGHFMRHLLLYFGSMHLASAANTFDLRPEAVLPGDTLLERWQSSGIGHTIPILRVDEVITDRFEVTVASGSMPRRQPVWEGPARARSTFFLSATGGPGDASDGTPYAKLGGGLKRWRVARVVGGRWQNTVPPNAVSDFIDAGDLGAIAARPGRFREILATPSPDERRDAAIAQVEAAREHLARYPASCAARTRREDAFDQLYEIGGEHYGWDVAEVDARYRTLADYVFAELSYEASRTCCWNRTNASMFEVVMDYARAEQAAAERDGVCLAPTVFRAEEGEGDGYARWASHAATLGQSDRWVAWSEDESCPWRDVPEDTATDRAGSAWCETAVADPVDPTPDAPVVDACDPLGQNPTRAEARDLTGAVSAQICAGDEDWYRVPAGGTVRLSFRHADGDLDLEATDGTGARIDSSTSVSDEETVSGVGEYFVRVYGYRGAIGAYTIRVLE